MRVQTVPVGPGLALFKIEGQLDFAGAPLVRSELSRITAGGTLTRMVIDLADVTTADDKGVSSLATAVRRLSVRQPKLRMIAVTKDGRLAGALADAAIPVLAYDGDASTFAHPRHAA
jgi:anti-anti-sigma regulatory factor